MLWRPFMCILVHTLNYQKSHAGPGLLVAHEHGQIMGNGRTLEAILNRLDAKNMQSIHQGVDPVLNVCDIVFVGGDDGVFFCFSPQPASNQNKPSVFCVWALLIGI